jgi:DNA-binding transcriptional LysR family regulator
MASVIFRPATIMASGPPIDFNLFVVLEAIFVEGSVTRAADKLNLSQPAISHALARLRELFGDPLFVRRGNSMVPTPLTRNNIAGVRAALRELERTLLDTRQFDPALAHRRLALCIPSSMEEALLPPLMSRIATRAPHVDLVTNRSERQRLEARLEAGVFDVAIDVLLQHSDEVLHQRVLRERLVVVARRDHPRIVPGFDLDAYLAQQHLLISTRREGPGIADVELSRLGLERHVRVRCQQTSAAGRIVADSNLIVTMLEYDALALNVFFDHQILPLPMAAEPIDLYMYWHGSVTSDPANCWLRGELEAVCSAISGDAPRL